MSPSRDLEEGFLKTKNTINKLTSLGDLSASSAKQFKGYENIEILCWILGGISALTLIIGMYRSSIMAIEDGISTLIIIFALVVSFKAIKYSMTHKEDSEYNYGYSRLTIIATFSNTIYLIFYFMFNGMHVLHEIIESYGDHTESEEVAHHGKSNASSFVTWVLIFKIMAYLWILFTTLSKIQMWPMIKPVYDWVKDEI